MALAFGAISMIITFISGMLSGVVRLGTLTLRSCLAFCIASAACYFLLMLFDMYNERLDKKDEQIAAEVAEGEQDNQSAEGENSAENFQPTEEYPNA